MTSDSILTELRTLPGAPDALRERVRQLPQPQPRFLWTFPRIDVRRSLLVAAPAVLALGVGAAALHGLLASGPKTPQPLALKAAQEGAHAGGGGWSSADGTTTVPRLAPQLALPQRSVTLGKRTALTPSATRLNKYNAWLRVRVADDRLAKATTRAMQIARGYGGYVASVDMNTPEKQGTASLVLRIPVTRVEDAVIRLGKLGDVTAQRVRIQDVQRQANRLEREIVKLRATIAELTRKLANGSITPEERFRLDQAKQALAQVTKSHATTIREGTLATVSMTFLTPQPAIVAPYHQGRLHRTLSNAGDFLVSELAWLLYALIVVGPIALLAAAAVFAVRTGRRRSDARLLEQA
jgi:hypothetical protein